MTMSRTGPTWAVSGPGPALGSGVLPAGSVAVVMEQGSGSRLCAATDPAMAHLWTPNPVEDRTQRQNGLPEQPAEDEQRHEPGREYPGAEQDGAARLERGPQPPSRRAEASQPESYDEVLQ